MTRIETLYACVVKEDGKPEELIQPLVFANKEELEKELPKWLVVGPYEIVEFRRVEK